VGAATEGLATGAKPTVFKFSGGVVSAGTVGAPAAPTHFREVLIADGSTLEALFRKLKALQELPKGRLAGTICTVIDLASQLPRYVWFTEAAVVPLFFQCLFLLNL
jgi:hypothetical protein